MPRGPGHWETYTDTSTGKLKRTRVWVPDPKPEPTRPRADIAPKTEPPKRSREYDVPRPSAEEARVNRAAQRQAAKAERRREAHDRVVAAQQAKTWGTEQGILPWETNLFKPKKPRGALPLGSRPIEEWGEPGIPMWKVREQARNEERRERAKLADAAMVPGSKEREEFVRGLSPQRRKELTKGRRLEPPKGWVPPQDRPKLGDAKPSAAGFGPFGLIDPSGHMRDVYSTLWGDVKTIGSGAYGSLEDYSGALYSDITKGTSKTPGLVGRDLTGLVQGIDVIAPRPGFMQPIAERFPRPRVDLKTGEWYFGGVRESSEEDISIAAKAWKEDPLISLLTAVSIAAPAVRVASVGAIAKGIVRVNPGMSMNQATKLAWKESRRPGYIAANHPGVLGGIRPRMIGPKRNVGEATSGARVAKPEGKLRYEEKGRPGYQVIDGPKGRKDAIFRDREGNVRGYATVGKNGSLSVYVDPEIRRQGVASELYGALERSGVDIAKLSGRGEMTPEGKALAENVGRVRAKNISRTPWGRHIQRCTTARRTSSRTCSDPKRRRWRASSRHRPGSGARRRALREPSSARPTRTRSARALSSIATRATSPGL